MFIGSDGRLKASAIDAGCWIRQTMVLHLAIHGRTRLRRHDAGDGFLSFWVTGAAAPGLTYSSGFNRELKDRLDQSPAEVVENILVSQTCK